MEETRRTTVGAKVPQGFCLWDGCYRTPMAGSQRCAQHQPRREKRRSYTLKPDQPVPGRLPREGTGESAVCQVQNTTATTVEEKLSLWPWEEGADA